MPVIKSKLVATVLKTSRLTKKEAERISNALKFGIKAWIKSAEQTIPVYSGASRASLDQLAAVVQMNVSTTPSPNAVKRLGPSKIASRQSQARASSEGGVEIRGKQIIFAYRTTLPWLVDNENGEANDVVAKSGNLITPIPYNFVDTANVAALAVIQKRLEGRTIDLRGILDVKIIR